jgi:probable HAF family extracellular repeat protein
LAALPEYVVTDLGTLGGLFSEGYDINASGQVVGTSVTPDDEGWHAFLWSGGVMQDLGTLGPVDETSSEANAINDEGQVVGKSSIADGSSTRHAFLWTADKGMRDLGTLGGPGSDAFDINSIGQVVGMAELNKLVPGADFHDAHPYLWTEAAGMKDLEAQVHGTVFAINARGQIVGGSPVTGAYRWTPGEDPRALGDLGGGAAPKAINASGQVVGDSALYTYDNIRHAFIWTESEGIRDLGTLIGERGFSGADDINASGQVVGWTGYPGAREDVHAFLWTAEDGMQDLNEAPGVKDSGWTLVYATGINDAGQIVANSGGRALLLTPVKLLCEGRVPTVLGGAGNDVLKGTSRKDVIQGRGGNDTIQAGGGNDIVCGGAGNDKLYGGAGKNKLSGGAGKDTCKQGEKRSGCER